MLSQGFRDKFEALRGTTSVARSVDEAAQQIFEGCKNANAQCVALGDLDAALAEAVRERCAAEGMDVLVPPYAAVDLPDQIDRADVGVGRVDHAIRETGTLIEITTDDAFRLVSALPTTYIGVVDAGTIVDTLADSASLLRAAFTENDRNCVASFISGPSRTGDIEMVLTLGVHGPEFAHAIVMENTNGQ